MTTAITVHNLGKCYRVTRAAKRAGYRTLREDLAGLAHAAFRRLRGHAARPRAEEFWALRDVSFAVRPGEVVGIIGRNGAGKSTLLKVLSRITRPSTGEVRLRGRVGSLLEVGTGFHPELSGRENIYLNGSILGMSRREVERKFDEIVAFSEVEEFLDTPVKRYSSGMYVRLAFAVAAHLEPEILIVDEVLAVGDVGFQKKCLGKMNEVGRDGRTVLIVSHNMSAIRTLCRRAVVLRQGQYAFDGDVEAAVKHYLSYLNETAEQAFADNPERSGNGGVRLTGACLLNEEGTPAADLVSGRAAALRLTYDNPAGLKRMDVLATVYNHLGVAVTNFDTRVTGTDLGGLAGRGEVRIALPRLPLPLGQYRVAVALWAGRETADLVPNAVVFHVRTSDFFPTGRTPDLNYCSCLVEHEWQHEAIPSTLSALEHA